MQLTLSVREIRDIIAKVAANYPEDIFLPPLSNKLSRQPPDCYTAAGARLACRRILEEIEKAVEDEPAR